MRRALIHALLLAFDLTLAPEKQGYAQSNRPLASNSPRKRCQIFGQTSCSSHLRIRRQQVAGLGYSEGRSSQQAPVLRTQRITSKHQRFSTQGRPFSPWAAAGAVARAFATSNRSKTFAEPYNPPRLLCQRSTMILISYKRAKMRL